VLVYAATGRVDYPEKYAVANALIREGRFAISTQVLGEFYAEVRYLQHEKLGIAEAREWIESLSVYCRMNVDQAIISSALFFRERFKIQFWDGALIAAAEKLGLKTLYSEDMSHKQKYGTVTVINPFKAV
jgi:predicted nucleic acid-binding protein